MNFEIYSTSSRNIRIIFPQIFPDGLVNDHGHRKAKYLSDPVNLMNYRVLRKYLNQKLRFFLLLFSYFSSDIYARSSGLLWILGW